MSSVALPSMRAPSKRTSPLRPHHAADRAQRRRLAGAVGAEDGGDAAVARRSKSSRAAPCVCAVLRASRPAHLEQRRGIMPRVPEVGADHVGIALHLGRRALGDLAAEVERDDLVGHAHHQVHVVLDQQHRQLAARSRMRRSRSHQRVDLLVVQPAGRLVEQQQLRLAGQRARQLDALLRAERQVRSRGASATALEVEQRDQLRRPARRAARSSRRTRGRRSALARKPLRGAAVAADHDVLAHAHACGTARGSGRCGRCRARRCRAPASSSSGRPSKRMSPSLNV